MKVKREDCIIGYKNHKQIKCYTGARRQIELYYKGEKYLYTHKGFIPADKENICACSVYRAEAKQIIANLEDTIELL